MLSLYVNSPQNTVIQAQVLLWIKKNCLLDFAAAFDHIDGICLLFPTAKRYPYMLIRHKTVSCMCGL